MEAVQLPGLQAFWQHQVLRGLAAGAAGDTALRRVRRPVVANTLQDSCLEDPPTEEPGGPAHRIAELDATRASLPAWTQAFPVAAPPRESWHEGGAAAGLVGALGRRGCGDADRLPAGAVAQAEALSQPL